MADEPQEKVFEDGPYAAKWMSADAKRTIFYAAKRAKMNQGQWIEHAARTAIEKEREPTTGTEILVPGSTAISTMVIEPDRSDLSMAELDIAARLAVHLAEVRGQPLTPGARNTAARTIGGVQRLLAKKIIGA